MIRLVVSAICSSRDGHRPTARVEYAASEGRDPGLPDPAWRVRNLSVRRLDDASYLTSTDSKAAHA